MFQQMIENKGDINPPKRRLIQIKKLHITIDY